MIERIRTLHRGLRALAAAVNTAAAAMLLANLGWSAAAFAADAPAPDPQACLACHGGSLEALADKTKDYKDEWGDPVNPHVYIDRDAADPHHGKKVLPDCTKCHEAHPIPPQPGMKVKEADVSYCFGCHHMETFEPCGKAGCHDKK